MQTGNMTLTQAQRLESHGRLVEAEAAYQRIVAENPGQHAAWHALGLMAFNAGRLPLAVRYIEAAIAGDSRIALYQRNVGELYRRMGLLEKSTQAGKRATKLAPTDLDAHYNLGLAYTDAGDYPHAVASYRRALKLNAGHGLSWNNLGSALEKLGDKTEALKCYREAIRLNPQHAEAQNNAGAIHSEQGDLDEARACFEAAISARPDFFEAHYNLSSLKKYTRDDPHLAMLEAGYAQRTQLHEPARIRYAFALGKALDDIGDHDRAFAAYEEGNRRQHALLPHDEAQADALMQQILTVFDADFFAARRDWSGALAPERTPIFIVGMPRSGTTLLEQILCSHASVHGAGELSDLNTVISQASSPQAFPASVTALSETDIRRIGEDYLQRVWKLSPDSRYITDKMPANFFYLGLIHLALPHARIIHAMRDPMDSCFSCYSRLFNDTMEFAYHQGTLGRYYGRYMTLMQHWHRVLPAGTILDLRYEDMVADTETQARRVLDFVGLPWDERCLKFYENTRLVRTASVAQVRKPIYKGSVARWKHFARHLQPLYREVRQWRPADDADTLFAPPATTLPQALIAQAEAAHVEGIALYRAGRFEAALEKYELALRETPLFPSALNSKGFLLQDLDRMDEALACFGKAVELAPEFAIARLNLGMAQLKTGDWENGWENYEARWTGSAEASQGTLRQPNCPLPQWNGEADTAGRSLLVITEQGFGDTFQFARYLALAAGRFARVGFVCSQPTQRLMEWAFADRIVTFTRMPADLSSWDLQCPLLSLPRAFATRPQTIPATLPYLKVPDKALAYWRERLDVAAPAGLRIGIAWAGRKAHQCDSRRSLRFNQILPLLHGTGLTWVSLQKWAPEDERPVIPDNVAWLDWTEELCDFADTAALISGLDLVVSIDSALVHLAGGLDKPVWMLNRYDSEWRWFRHRSDSPWYPAMRIFNQPAFGDWDSVLQEVRQALVMLPRQARERRALRPRPEPRPTPPVLAALSIEQAMQRASQHQSSGRLAEAEQLLQQILQAQPRHAHALHLLGIVAHQAGQPARAVQRITEAIALEAGVALFHSNLAEMLRQQGRLAEAIRHGEQAVVLDPSLASAHSNLGIAHYDAGDLERAEACQQKALTLAPGMLQALNNLGSIERTRRNLKTAARWYRDALAIHPDYLESLSNLGAVLVEDEQADAAVAPLERALQLLPHYPEALCNLGLVRLKQDRHELAAGLLRRALQLRPGYPEAMLGLARVLQAQDQLPETHALLQELLQRHPDRSEAWSLLGTVCIERALPEEAEKAFQQAQALEPGRVEALTGLGNLRLEQGRIDEAEALLRQALTMEPDNLGAHFHLVQTRKVRADDPNLPVLEAMQPETFSTEQQISLHYALGKAFDDLQRWEPAFAHFIAGARLKRAKLDYDPDTDAARIRRIIEIVDAGFIERLQGAGNPSEVPIFVLGMPRSGTTLTEQIIASHPEVFGAGELRDLLEVVQQPVAGQLQPAYPENLAALTTETLSAWGTDYVARLRRRAPEARRITDKMPANYLALGLIPLLLPNAKIIHVQRNPVDTCVSCFTRLFNRHQDATYDLAELGRHYAGYARLMEHWRRVLPADRFLDVRYEDIVADMETQARRLIDWCGLEWNDACLAFHKNTRSIRTASVTQVRQPIYSSSVERWRHYEAFLGPLFEGLGEFAPPR